MDVGRPQLFVKFGRVFGIESYRRDIIYKRVEPDVDDVFTVEVDGDTPFESRALNAQILQFGPDCSVFAGF